MLFRESLSFSQMTIPEQIGQRSINYPYLCACRVVFACLLIDRFERPWRVVPAAVEVPPSQIVMFGCRRFIIRDISSFCTLWVCVRVAWAALVTGRHSITVDNANRHVRVVGIATDVTAGVAAPAHGARRAGGLQRARGGRGARAAPLAHCEATPGQAQEGSPVMCRPHRRRQCRAWALLAHGRAQGFLATATIQVSWTSWWS